MNKTVNEIRLFLFTCSGEDYFILKRCKKRIQSWFAFIGFFVVLIFVGCFFSASCFAYSLFEGAKWTSVPIGVFWGATVVNIYLLLLHTISPAIIPLASKKKKKKNDAVNELKSPFLSLSMFCRLGFMALLAIIIAQPLNVFLLSSTVQSSIDKHKLHERVKLYSMTNKSLIEYELQCKDAFIKNVESHGTSQEIQNLGRLSIIHTKIAGDKLFLLNTSVKLKQLNKTDENLFLNTNQKRKKQKLLNELETLLDNELVSDENFIADLQNVSVSSNLKNDFDGFRTEISVLIQDKINNYNALNELLGKSNFYIKTIQLLLIENPASWLITVSVCLVFLLPIGLKYKARDISAKLFFENNKEDGQLFKLREELINTTDFDWLEKRIKSENISDVRTSDYYFQRMLVEHKIILEEYEQTKKTFSGLLTANIKKFNRQSLVKLLPLLEKLKKVNPSKYIDFSKKIYEAYKDEIIIKYEYWLDCPFRTKRDEIIEIAENQVGLLDFLYDMPEDDNTELP